MTVSDLQPPWQLTWSREYMDGVRGPYVDAINDAAFAL